MYYYICVYHKYICVHKAAFITTNLGQFVWIGIRCFKFVIWLTLSALWSLKLKKIKFKYQIYSYKNQVAYSPIC